MRFATVPPADVGQWPTIDESRPAKRHQRLRLAPGQIIPGTSWRITRWLGEGSMGVVYEARHVEIDRRAAIKVVAASLTDDSVAVDRFRGEARAAASIGSPNIIDVFDFAVLHDGRLMMAMEFVPGRSLQDIHASEGRLEPARLIGLFRQVCKGLQAAHEAGLVHRDIKPENIMVGEVAGRRDTVKLVDFGIVAILGQRLSTYAGTPYYMPPEGMRGGPIDGRYDIYSVGCVMYEMLAGKPPYVALETESVLEMHRTESVPELVSDGGDVPRKLIEVVRRCLAKDPNDRFESMVELEAALCEAQIEGKLRTTWDDLALPALDLERHDKLLARMPVRVVKRGVSGWWLPLLLVVGVVVGGLIAWPVLHSDSPRVGVATRTAVAAFFGRVEAVTARVEAIGPRVDLEDLPSTIAPRETTIPPLRPPAPVTGLLAASHEGSADAIVAAAKAARRLARLKDAETLYQQALRIEPHRVDALAGLGRVYFERGNYAKAVTYFEHAVGRSGRDVSLRISLGDAYTKRLDYDQALVQYAKAEQLGSSKATKRIKRLERTGLEAPN